MKTIKLQKPNPTTPKKFDDSQLDRRIWSMKRDLYKTNLAEHVQIKEKECSGIYSLLFEKKENGPKKPLVFKRKFFHQKIKKLFSNQVSEKCENILSTVYTKINHMKTNSKKLQKMNSLSMQKTSNKLFRPCTITPSSKSIYSNNLYSNYNNNTKYFSTISTNFNTNSSNRFSSRSRNKKKDKLVFCKREAIENNYTKNAEKFKKLGSLDLPSLYNSIQYKNLNFTRLNDNYRNEMNRIFKLYNAEHYLKKLNVLQKENMVVRQEMEDIKKKINIKISDQCVGQYFKKQYEKLKSAENNTVDSGRRLSTLPDKIPFDIKFIDNNESLKIFPNGYKIRALYEYSAKKNKKKKKLNKNIKISGNSNYTISKTFEKDYELIDDTLEKVFGSLENKPIINIIDNIIQKRLAKGEDRKNRERKFFPGFRDIENYLNKKQINEIKLYSENPENIEKCIKKLEGDIKKIVDNDKKCKSENKK